MINRLVGLHAALVELERKGEKRRPASTRSAKPSEGPSLFDAHFAERSADALLRQANEVIYGSLGLDDEDRVLVEDFVRVRFSSNQGKVNEDVVKSPETDEIAAYTNILADELDSFLEDISDKRHMVNVFVDAESRSGLIEITPQQKSRKAQPHHIYSASKDMSKSMQDIRERIRKEKGQWLYFERNLRISEGRCIYLLKPLQRIHWLRSQAILDADLILHDLVNQGA
jgi:hypothetical protein